MSRCAESKLNLIKLNSPAGGKPMLMSVRTRRHSDSDSEDDLDNVIKTIRFIGKDNTILPIDDIIPGTVKNYGTIVNVCNKYNRCVNTIKFLEDGTSLTRIRVSKSPSRDLTNFVVQQCYKRAVKHPTKLNKYDPFSPEVYGETSFELICLIIDSLNITQDDVFLDLGSGIGQVVLQVAALTPCKLSMGIEKNLIPSSYATNMSAYFNSWMLFFGKNVGKVELYQKDFLHDDCLELIRKATIIFVNNISFGPQINHELTLRFQDLRDGVRIISPVTFCPEKFRITGRSLGNIASIMSIVEIPQLKGPVSWTSKSVAYYIHVIDRRKLENFFVQCVRKHENDEHKWKKTYNGEPTKFASVFSEDFDSESTLSKSDSNEATLTASSSQTSETPEVEIANKLDKLLSNFAKQYEEMLQTMKQDSYKSFIMEHIEEERQKNLQLRKTVAFFEKRIQFLENEHQALFT